MSLIIREAEPRDAAQMISFVQRLAQEPGINILIGPGEFNQTVEKQETVVTNYAAADNSVFLLAEAEGRIVGVLNCNGGKRRAVRHVADLGISLAREWRNQGIGHTLMEGAIEWARGTGIITRIQLAVFAGNAPAIHLYEKFGFEHEGRRRRAAYRDGEYHDNLIMALLLDKRVEANRLSNNLRRQP